jgi:FAD/FMN-containing dehydrogenase/Fe-S oxidoreductase
MRRAGLREVDATVRRRGEYSSDASNYRVVPKVVVFPRHIDEVCTAMDVARREGVPVTARGAGTSIAGNAVGTGIVLDFSRHMNRVLSVNADDRSAVVEPGAVLDSITAAVSAFGLRFGPDPSTHSRATIGGSLGNNACGSRALRYGRTADNVEALDVVLSSGERINARRFGAEGLAKASLPFGSGLAALVDSNADLIRREFGRFRRQVSGYSIEHLLPERGSDLARFLVGSEGTLGLTVGARVRLVASPPAVALAVLGYQDIAAAADATPALLHHPIVALEGMDARLVDVVRVRRGPGAVPPLPRGGGWLLVETPGVAPAEAEANAKKVVADSSCLEAVVVTGADAQAIWKIREDGAGLGGRTPANKPAWPGWEDAAVPPGQLGPYLRDFESLLRDHGLGGLLYGHFGDGCIHVRIDFPFRGDTRRFRTFVEEAAALVAGYGGSMSGEHGDGRARSELLRYMYSEPALDLFAQVKRIFDPVGLLNPGVIVAPASVDSDLRVPEAKQLRTALAFSYDEDGGDLSTAVHRCVGVGKCRADTTASGGVMCPSFLATGDEKDSTRARARILQEAANGRLVEGLKSDAVADSLDLCLSCKGCSSDCPTGIDMATYKAEVLYQRYRRRLRPASHYSLGWLPWAARIGARFPRLTNAALGQPRLAALIKQLGGIDQRRSLPEMAAPTFREWFVSRRHDLPQPGGPAVRPSAVPSASGKGRVLLWVDTFTEHFSPETGKAVVRVLEDAGYSIELTESQVCCGLTWISTGQLDIARRQIQRSLDALGGALAEGLPVVGIEPSCLAVLRKDAADLLPHDPRAERLRTATKTLAELLTSTDGWIPPDLSGVIGVAQPHCHHHAVLGWANDALLLTRAGAQIRRVGGCCGLAGNFGVEEGHYEVSVKVAETALLPALAAAPGDAVVLADGYSCRTQIDDLAGVSAIHLAQLLASHL